MELKKFLEPKEIEIKGTNYIISKIPAIQAQQIYGAIMRECKEEGDIGMTYISEETAINLLAYTAMGSGEEAQVLEGRDRINVACSDIEKLIKLEAAMIRYNFSFLFDGVLQDVLEVLQSSSADI